VTDMMAGALGPRAILLCGLFLVVWRGAAQNALDFSQSVSSAQFSCMRANGIGCVGLVCWCWIPPV
jgi:hypothetical protein